MRYSKKNLIVNSADDFLRIHQAPVTISYMWNFGVYSLVCLIIQIITGILLSGYYIPHPDFAFDSVEKVMRDVSYGWLFRYMHSNGASFFFIAVYIHMFRGLYYTSFTDEKKPVWYSGAMIFFLMIITAFLGYVLPWGQISYWGAIVITNFLSAVPKIGPDLVVWVWGGYSISSVTLIRFYALHFTLPFTIAALVAIHLVYLHNAGHSNPQGQESEQDNTSFFPYFITKDLVGLWAFFSIYLIFVFFFPNYLGHPDNYIKANPLVTPSHIVPEWYFLPFYAILRSIPNKFFGVIFLLASIACIFLLPLLFKTELVSISVRKYSRYFFFWFLLNALLLGWIGNQPAEYPYTIIGMISTFFYFGYFLIFGPIAIYVENTEDMARFRRLNKIHWSWNS